VSQEPLISVLIPAYNHEKYIGPAMLSVLNQTHKNIELLVLDDGSTDRTYDVIKYVANTDARVTCWRQKNAGVVTTINTLAQRASGEFIAHLGSDDLWMPKRLAWGVEDMRQNPQLSATFCDYMTVNNDLIPIKPVDPFAFKPIRGVDLASQLIFNNRVGALTAFIRASCLEGIGPFAQDLDACHDWDLWLRLATVGELNMRADIGALYRWHGDNMSSKNHAILAKEILWVLENTSPKVAEHYQIGQQTQRALNLRKAQHAMNFGFAEKAIELLLHQGDHTPLDDTESLTLLYSLHLTKRYQHAISLRDILNERKNSLSDGLRSDLIKISAMIEQSEATV
jgi:alpha-1,3-rhamnosyltransferase